MTLRSMTGYGAAVAELPVADGRALRYRVQLKSVNHRFLDVRCKLGRELARLEALVVARLRSRLQRGHVDVFVDPEPGGALVQVQVDRALAARVHDALQDVRRSVALSDEVTLRDVMSVGGVLTVAPVGLDVDAHTESLMAAIDRALDELVAMRATEGARLATDLLERFDHLGKLAASVASAGDRASAERAARMRARIAELAVEVDEQRFAVEVALLADRSDVSEEVTRIDSHLMQARAEVQREPLGRGKKLEFLSQELLREFNTIGSKVGDTEITGWVIDAKCELEKVREQVANLE